MMRLPSIVVAVVLVTAVGLAGSVDQAHGRVPGPAGALTGVNHLDPAFGDRGLVRIYDPKGGASLSSLALQPDGKIVAAGQYRGAMLVARYTSAGALDPSFGGTGIVTATIGSGSSPYASTALALQPDGKIVVGGSASNDFVLVRTSAEGELDASFGGSGVVTTSIGLQSVDAITALALQPDGKIVVAGTTSSIGADSGAVVLARYTTAGALDASFSGGIATTDLGCKYCNVAALALQPDGKIVAAGVYGQTDFGVERFTASGVPDASFGINGTVTTNLGQNTYGNINALALQPDGKIVAAGARLFSGEPPIFALARYTSTGGLDATFGEGGLVLSAINSAANSATALALQPDGKIMAAGLSSTFCSRTCDWRFTLARYQRDGRLDRSFGGVGSITSNVYGNIAALALQPDGKIVAAGTLYPPSGVNQAPTALLARFIDDADAVFLPVARR